VVNPVSSETVYAFAASVLRGSSLFRTTNGGRSWTRLLSPAPCALAIDPRQPDRLLAGIGSGVQESTDGGLSWNALGISVSTCVYRILFDPSRPDVVYAAASGALFRSLDGGLSWTTLELPTSVSSVDLSRDGTVFVGSVSGPATAILRSVDRGQSWFPVSVPSLGTNPGFFRIITDPVSPTTLYVVAAAGIFRSADAGISWEARGKGYALSFAIDPKDTVALYAGGYGGVWKSLDAGAMWQPVGVSLPFPTSAAVISLAIDPVRPATLFGGTNGGGLFKSLDGAATWNSSDRGLPGLPMLTLVVDAGNPAALLAGTQVASFQYGGASVYRSADAGSHWTSIRSFVNVTALASDPQDQATIYVGEGFCYPTIGCLGGISKTSNGGASWSKLPVNGPVQALAVGPGSPGVVFAETWNQPIPVFQSRTYAGIKSLDGGLTWNTLAGGFPSVAVSQFVIDSSRPEVVYVASDGGVFRTADGGATWSAANLGLTELSISALVMDPQSSRTLYAGTKAGVFKTSDGGASWARTGFAAPVTAIAIDPLDSRLLFVSVSSGAVQRSQDSGETWSQLDLDPNLGINALTIDSGGFFLHVATNSGVYELELRKPTRTVAPRD